VRCGFRTAPAETISLLNTREHTPAHLPSGLFKGLSATLRFEPGLPHSVDMAVAHEVEVLDEILADGWKGGELPELLQEAMVAARVTLAELLPVPGGKLAEHAVAHGLPAPQTSTEEEVLLRHFENCQQSAGGQVFNALNGLYARQEKHKRVMEMTRQLESTTVATSPIATGVNMALASQEERRMEQIRAKQQAEMEAAIRGELAAAERTREAQKKAKEAAAADAARRRAIDAERKKAAEERKKQRAAKAKKEADRLEAAERAQRQQFEADLKLHAEKEQERLERKKELELKAKEKEREMEELAKEKEHMAELAAAAADERAVAAEERQAKLLEVLEQKREGQRRVMAEKAEIVRVRIEAAREKQQEQKRQDRERLLAGIQEAERRFKDKQKEIRDELALKARERVMKDKEVKGRIEKTRSDVERWRDALAKKQQGSGSALAAVEAKQREAMRATVLDASLRTQRKQLAVERRKAQEQARLQEMRSRLEISLAATKEIENRKALMAKQVRDNARRLLVAKHSLQDEMDMLLITKRWDSAKKMLNKASPGEEVAGEGDA
jgi:hypothetical protein